VQPDAGTQPAALAVAVPQLTPPPSAAPAQPAPGAAAVAGAASASAAAIESAVSGQRAGALPVNPLTAAGVVSTAAVTAASASTATPWQAASGSANTCSHRFELCSADADCCALGAGRAFCMWSASLVEYDPTAPDNMRLVGSGVQFCGQAGDGHIVPGR